MHARLSGSLSTMPVSIFMSQAFVFLTILMQISIGTFSRELQDSALPNGGADGSILVDPNEVLRSENNGLQNIVSLLQPLPDQFGVSPGDIVQVRFSNISVNSSFQSDPHSQIAGILAVVR
jgi:hypothetical protein